MTYETRSEDIREVPPKYDLVIKAALEKLSLEELAKLSDESGTTANSGYLMSHAHENSREDYISELSETTDKAEWQFVKIYKALNIKK
jgi:hypothetical protein